MLAAQRMHAALKERSRKGLLRRLREPDPEAVDFASNDYLGVSKRRCLSKGVTPDAGSGATGSRLLSGHSREAAALEALAAAFHHAPAALLCNSGYDANLGFYSCVPQRADVILYDELIHASIHDGMRLGRARESLFPFPHNCVMGLRHRVFSVLRNRDGAQRPQVIFVAVESVYSMDGDVAPLRDMLDLCQELSTPEMSVLLVVDEAHGVGIAGPNGEGLVVALGLHDHPNLLSRVVTFGKAFGAHGALILGNELLRDYLINYSRPFIYSTALPPHSIFTLMKAYSYMRTPDAHKARKTLISRRDAFRKAARQSLPARSLMDEGVSSPIQGILVPGNRQCVAVAESVRRAGYDVYPVRSPTVPKGTERIRVIVHSHNTDDEVEGLISALARAMRDVAAYPEAASPL